MGTQSTWAKNKNLVIIKKNKKPKNKYLVIIKKTKKPKNKNLVIIKKNKKPKNKNLVIIKQPLPKRFSHSRESKNTKLQLLSRKFINHVWHVSNYQETRIYDFILKTFTVMF